MILRVLTTVSCAAAMAVPMAGPASAATVTYQTGPVINACDLLPGVTPQPGTMTTRFDAPDSVASGTTVTPAGVGGGVRFEAGPHAILTAYGYDGFRGHVDLGLSATGATLSGPSATGLTVPEQIYPAGGAFEIQFEQGPGAVVPSLTAGPPGTATVKVTTTATFTLEVHKKSTGVWNPWTMTCNIRVTNPPQNPEFSPSIPVT
ncbi:hypothetical protein AMES_1753 [Amycolatopsis mediterranei S699]|uniref:DUF6801 domain-containing protein n=2 Tax=Amycolatopsis mediterranei TaxID=33910 RepID=A0A0H3CY52_AMYMU|nr:DUF6801 domain-containing protein [Amycolatopsis mediterranei]ADJ43577.1 hypothetical protein AMED_1766 [Amycolatopsis mediterranei U32]AEK40283.1 hypothetical protein RAM_08965 [Amycolatopsis mediterranei S699]AFO75289.1 hypothetical protein AMES_1753 [Amycolatopsis mediterranei S699]AGT82418.1 hypothetical protein B737_1754 [Amycolatopsis mediterranei RB]KDO03776.1 hypothetical protein DV26_47220 [Amycolatopsis mediterranei]